MLVKSLSGSGWGPRELIVRAFNELVAEKGYTGLTVQEIAERATINRAAFYAHFADQYELFDYVISEASGKSCGEDCPTRLDSVKRASRR